MAASQLERISQGFIGRLNGAEQKALAETARAYKIAARQLEPLWRQAYAMLQAAVEAGADPDYLTGFIWREQRAARMLADMGTIFEQLGAKTGATLTEAQRDAIAIVQQSFVDVMALATGEAATSVMATLGASFPQALFERMVGSLTDGSPIIDLAKRYGESGPRVIREALLAGVANGDNPRLVARRINKALGQHYGNTSVLTRTEMLRVYREGTRETYLANRKYVQGWIWCSALDHRTCPVCWAMHGTKHPLGEPMASHPVCRCSMVPWLIPSPLIQPLPDMRPGTEVFAEQPESVQRFVLGPMALRAYQQGMIALPDLVKETFSPTWGAGRTRRSLVSVLGPQRLASLS